MPIHFDAAVSFEDPDVKRFLHSKNISSLTLHPSIPDDFEHNTNDWRESGEPRVVTQDITYLVEEHYQLSDNGNTAGIHRVVVALGHQIDISVKYWAIFRKGISDAAKAHGLNLLRTYDPVIHGEDIEAWALVNLGPDLQQDDFILDTAVTLKKLDAQNPIEVDVSQRKALFQLFGLEQPILDSEINAISDYSLGQWQRERNISLSLVYEEVVLDDGEPVENPNNVRTVNAGQASNPAVAGRILDRILAEIIPSSCGEMQRKQHKLLTIAAWPEFKIEWRKIRIKVGCSRITISIPILRVRTSQLVFYVYYSLPRNLGRTVFKIAETCAIRSALGSSIIGIVTSNIAAAKASFIPLFKLCLEREAKECIHPGLLLLKESGSWS